MKTKKNNAKEYIKLIELQNKVQMKQQEVWHLERKARHIETLANMVEIDNMIIKGTRDIMKQINVESKKMQKEIEAEAQKKTAGFTLFFIAMNIILILSVIL